MKMTNTLLLSTTIALGLTTSASGADLVYLTTAADAIVVGAVSTRLENADLVSFDIAVERVIKGNTSLTIAHISHPWKRGGVVIDNQSDQRINATIRGLWFLQRTALGWDLIPANGPDGMLFNLYLPAAQIVPQRYAATPVAGPLGSTVIEVAAGAEAEGNRVRTAVDLLMAIRTPVVSTVTAAYLASPSPAFQSAGVALALAQNGPNVMATLTRFWPALSQEPARVHIVSSLRDSYRDVSPAAVTQLAEITGNVNFSELRPAALRALAAIHTKEALPVLARLLQSTDPDERMTGVFGLSSFANGCPVQTPDNVVSLEYLQFKNPSPYRNPDTIAHFAFRRGPAEQELELTSFWLNWWNEHQSELIK